MMNVDTYASRLSENSMLMLLLHGVVEHQVSEVRNYNRKHILKDEFVALMRALKAHGNALSVDDYVNLREQGGRLPPHSFIVTFDDGFENNYSVAAPVLADMGIPAIVYATTRFIDENLMSWIDRIDYAVEQTEKTSLTLSLFPGPRSVATTEEKIRLLDDIRFAVKTDSSLFLRIEDIIAEIFDACRIDAVCSGDGPLDRKMNWEQVSRLHADPLFSVGGHTHNHDIMSYLGAEALEKDVSTCLAKINRAVNDNIRHFCYPEGLAHCYNDSVIDCLKRHGIVCSPSAIDGVNPLTADLFHLKRVFVV